MAIMTSIGRKYLTAIESAQNQAAFLTDEEVRRQTLNDLIYLKFAFLQESNRARRWRWIVGFFILLIMGSTGPPR